VFVLVVAVTKVMILSTLFSLKEEQDHMRERVAAGVTFVTLFFLKLNPRPPTARASAEGRVSAPSFQQPECVRAKQ
jgi:hypothetical protein